MASSHLGMPLLLARSRTLPGDGCKSLTPSKTVWGGKAHIEASTWLLVSRDSPTGQTPFSQWLAQNASTLGTRYASELARHYR
ncbi:MAG: hypothetical protein HYY00_07385 [Chloroflexi bacterium]|nr:hypothetical protein [Chloroflexota bacterium]